MTLTSTGKGARARDSLTPNSPFRFRCHPGLGCFTTCCRDVNIFLTPYDILRIKRRLNISSEQFLSQYTVTLIPKTSGFPLVVLKMRQDKQKTCPFVGRSGCSIYEDRPWSCRMYPLDRGEQDGQFHRIADPSVCLGLKEKETRKVRDYFHDQGIDPYEEMEVALRKLTSDPRLSREMIENQEIQEMLRMALYDLDRFRRFVFESRFLDIFQVDEETVERIREDDFELMKLAHRWLEFGLISGDAFKIREDILTKAKRERDRGRAADDSPGDER